MGTTFTYYEGGAIPWNSEQDSEQIFDTAKTRDPQQTVMISCPSKGVRVIADLPEQWSLGITSDWESPLPYSLGNLLSKALGSFGEGITAAIGSNPQVQEMSYQVWMGTAPLELPITLLFDAETSAKQDVWEPIIQLGKCGFPRKNGYLLDPPGPRRGGGGSGVNVKLGRMLYLRDSIMMSGTPQFDSRLAEDGYPISGQIELTFRTSIVYSDADWLAATGGGAPTPYAGAID